MLKPKDTPMSKQNTPAWIKPAEASDPTSNSSKNAIKHGCCAASTLLLPHENEADYQALEATWLKAYNPTSDPERHLVQELVNADWLLQRTTAAYVKVEADLYLLNSDPSAWTESQERKLGRHLRYRTAQMNLVVKARKAVEDFRKARLNEKAQVEKQSIAQERLKIHKQKNQPEPNWKEHLQTMKAKAISLGFTPPELPLDPTRRY